MKQCEKFISSRKKKKPHLMFLHCEICLSLGEGGEEGSL